MTPSPRRRLRPSPDDVLGGLVRPRAAAAYRATVAPLRDDEWLRRLPYVELRAVDGTATRMVRHVTTAEIEVDCWAGERRTADDLDDLVLEALLDAKRDGTVAARGYLGGLEVVRLGAELRTGDQPGDVWRWNAAYRALIRPAR